MKYRHFVIGENLKQGVFFVLSGGSQLSVEVRVRSKRQSKLTTNRV